MLEVSDLVVRYGGITALKGVSLTVEEGEYVGIVGPNGAGKTSLLMAIAGAVPAHGDIRLRGERIRGENPEAIVERGISLVPEGRNIFASLTVKENLLLGASRFGRWQNGDELSKVLDIFPDL